MTRKPSNWIRLPDSFEDDLSRYRLTAEESWYYVCMILCCFRRQAYDGVITRRDAERCATAADPGALVDRLTNAGLIVSAGGDQVCHAVTPIARTVSQGHDVGFDTVATPGIELDVAHPDLMAFMEGEDGEALAPEPVAVDLGRPRPTRHPGRVVLVRLPHLTQREVSGAHSVTPNARAVKHGQSCDPQWQQTGVTKGAMPG